MSSGEGRLREAFILTLAGSVMLLILGVIMSIMPAITVGGVTYFMPSLPGLLMTLVSLVPGVIGLVASILIRSEYRIAGGVLAITAAVVSVPLLLGGMTAGLLALLIGGALALTSS